mgnify:CR=1 FL=1
MITKNIPIIDNSKVPKNINKLIDDYFGDNRLNAYQILYLDDDADDDEDSNVVIITKWLRKNGIQGGQVLIDNRW